MNGETKIRNRWAEMTNQGEANALSIWKGQGPNGMAYGWWVKPFGKVAQALGNTVEEALEMIQSWIIEMQEV